MAGPFHVNMPDLIAKLNELWEDVDEGGGGGGGGSLLIEEDGTEVEDAVEEINVLPPLTATLDGAGRVEIGANLPEGTDETSVFVVNNVVNQFTKQQYTAPVVLTPASGITIDAEASDMFLLDLNQNIMLHAPNNLEAGMKFQIVVTQDEATPFELSFNSIFKFPAAGASQVSQETSAKDVISCAYDGTDLLAVFSQNHGGTPP